MAQVEGLEQRPGGEGPTHPSQHGGAGLDVGAGAAGVAALLGDEGATSAVLGIHRIPSRSKLLRGVAKPSTVLPNMPMPGARDQAP